MTDDGKFKQMSEKRKREIELKNRARRAAGLSLIWVRIRRCDLCDKPFESAGERTCGCRNREMSQYDP